MSRLSIVKASAGSGKTFNLTRRYITLLFRKPSYYAHILAVTFTNKATEEMKGRILKELAILSKTPEQSAHSKFLEAELKLSEYKIKDKAALVLQHLLHGYSKFHISTIDRFFQHIIRVFIREIGYTQLYNIELDSNMVVESAVDLLFFDLSKEEHPKLLSWLSRFSEDQIQQGKNWKIKGKVVALGKEIIKESSPFYNQELGSEHLKPLGALMQVLQKENAAIEKKFSDLIFGIKTCVSNAGLEITDFSGKERSAVGLAYKFGDIKNLDAKQSIQATILKAIDNPGVLATKTSSKRGEIIALAENFLVAYFKQLENLCANDLLQYNTNRLLMKNFYTLGVLYYLNDKIKEFSRDQNLMLLSNANRFISDIIGNSDTPFIYEKTGNTFFHYMIDEFQDTSALQWNNFKPLLNESLSFGRANLIVGDEKQSIYRWRNSDWQLLGHKIVGDFPPERILEERLPSNYRSKKNIVLFNNSLFTRLKNLVKNENESSKVDLAYGNIVQINEVTDACEGEVRASFIEEKNIEDFKHESLNRLESLLNELRNKGYGLKDIALLVRKKDEATLLSDFLTSTTQNNSMSSSEPFKVVSNEAFLLKNASSVQFIILLFRYETNQSNYAKFELETYYQNYIAPNITMELSLDELLEENNNDYEAIQNSISGKTYAYIRCFKLNEMGSEALFIESFLDFVKGFEDKRSANLSDFLVYYDQAAEKLSISQSSSMDAIQILTVHKSKGLEYPIVILPFLSWDLVPKSSNFIWHHYTQNGFDVHLPVQTSQALANSTLLELYATEKDLELIDNVNILYVACTRAAEGLFIHAQKGGKQNSIQKLFEDAFSFSETIEDENFQLDLSLGYNEEESVFKLGELLPKTIEDSITPTFDTLQINPLYNKVRLKNQFGVKQASKTEAIHGKLLHKLFERIKYADDVPESIRYFASNGFISEAEREKYQSYLSMLMASNALVESWFSRKNKVWVEQEIILPKKSSLRPDRMVKLDKELHIIDYKFGDLERTSYLGQVKNYVSVLKEVGYATIKGYVWYVKLGKIVSV